MHFSLVKRGWRGMFSFGSIARVHPLFLLSISSIRQSPMILLLLPFLCFFLENLEKRTRWSKCFLLAACFLFSKGEVRTPFTGEKQVSVNEFINYEGNQLMRKPKLLRALLILLFVAAPIQWTRAKSFFQLPRQRLEQ